MDFIELEVSNAREENIQYYLLLITPLYFKLYPPLKITKKAPVIESFNCLKPSAYSQLIFTVCGYLYFLSLDNVEKIE